MYLYIYAIPFNIIILGYLKEKTCILITHQLQYLSNVDYIILMENVRIGNSNNFYFVDLY